MKANGLFQALTTLSVEAVASMSAMLGRAGIRQRSAWRMADVVAALTPPAVSTIASVTPSRCQRLQALLDIGGDIDRLYDRLGIGTPALPVRERALRVGLDQADGVSSLDGRKREADGKRAFSGTTLLGGQYDRLH